MGRVGTSLKPMFEPIIVGRKPLSEKSVAENVLKYGTGGINIDACRIPINREVDKKQDRIINRNVNELNKEKGWGFNNNTTQEQLQVLDMEKGRFPGNVILDEYTGEILDKQVGNVSFGNNSKGYTYLDKEYEVEGFISKIKPNSPSNYGDNGGASRFFYCAKASPKEKNLGMGNDDKNNHISVKPLTLMKYLIRLVTNKNGICLDPFIGSGTTGCACIEENIKFIGIEQDENYFNIANKRIAHYINDKNDILSEFI